MRRTKKYLKVSSKIDRTREYPLEEALSILPKLHFANFKGSVELHLALNLPSNKDPKSIKGSLVLPHMISKKTVVAVAVPEELVDKAKAAGADIAGVDEIVAQVQEGKINFDVLLAVPEVMPKLASLGKVLGPKGLMPNPKNGTVVTPDKLEDAVKEFKKGKILFKADAIGGIHIYVGKLEQPAEQLRENIVAVINTIVSIIGKSKESLIRKAYLAPSMGPAVRLDLRSL